MKKILLLAALLYAVLFINAQEDTIPEKTLEEVVISANKFSERKRKSHCKFQCTKYRRSADQYGKRFCSKKPARGKQSCYSWV
jgi:hypothetical protein